MPGVFKRKSDKERGKEGKWTCWWVGEDGRQKTKVGFKDKQESLELAQRLEVKCRLIRDGLLDPDEQVRKETAARPISDVLADYRKALDSRGNTAKHNTQTIRSIADVFEGAGIASVGDLIPDRIHAGVARLRKARSTRTANYALAAVKTLVRWLEDTGRIKQAPKGMNKIRPYPAKSDLRRVRRALGREEIDRLLAAAESGPDLIKRYGTNGGPVVAVITGADRAMIYRLAMATGFRANEIRQLKPEDFRLDGDSPTITCRANNSKRGKRSGRDDVQPIRREMVAVFRDYLAGKSPGGPVVFVHDKTSAMIRADLEAAGIPFADAEGRVIDFHALRVSYITDLIRSGVNVKEAQILARHSDVSLTLNTYTKLEDPEIRKALERGSRSHPSPDAGPDDPPKIT